METGVESSPWPMVLLNPTQKLCGRELLGAKTRAKNVMVQRMGRAEGVPGAVKRSGIDVA